MAEQKAIARVRKSNPRPSPDVLWRRIDNEVVLMQLKTDRMFSLNRTGARFWELIAAGSPLEEAHVSLAREFDVDPEQLRLEIERIVDLLAAEQLLASEDC